MLASAGCDGCAIEAPSLSRWDKPLLGGRDGDGDLGDLGDFGDFGFFGRPVLTV
jgi:hypothetical protein